MPEKRFQIPLMLFVLSFLLGFTSEPTKVNFMDVSFKDAMAASKKQHKPLFIYIGTEHCDDCRKMHSVFNDTSVANYYNTNFVCLRMDPDNIMNNMRITEWGLYQTPSFVYMNNRKYIYLKHSGILNSQEFLNNGKKVIKNIKDF